MSELLNCPFCGGELELYIFDDTNDSKDPYWVGGATCEQCGVGFEVGSFASGFTVDEIEKWIIRTLNRRAF